MKKTIILITVLLLALGFLTTGGLMAYKMFFSAPVAEAPPTPEPAAPKVEMGPTSELSFLVNLTDPGRPRYLKIELECELDGEAGLAEIEILEPRVRDSLITLLSSKNSADLLSVADKEKLRNDILHRLNTLMTNGKVVEVYFTGFTVQ